MQRPLLEKQDYTPPETELEEIVLIPACGVFGVDLYRNGDSVDEVSCFCYTGSKT